MGPMEISQYRSDKMDSLGELVGWRRRYFGFNDVRCGTSDSPCGYNKEMERRVLNSWSYYIAVYFILIIYVNFSHGCLPV